MGRILHITTRPSLPRRAIVAAVVGMIAAGLPALTRWGDDPPDAAPSVPATARDARAAAVDPVEAPAGSDTVAVAAPPATAPCAIQGLLLGLGGGPLRTVCMDATVVQQNGSVRTYALRPADADGWSLRLDMADRSLLSVELRARDGRVYACEAPQCRGDVAVDAPPSAHLTLRDLRLAAAASPASSMPAAADDATISGRLRVPADDQVPGLACTGPSVTLSVASGARHRFCGQGGAGVEIADDGQRHYRFHDHEGRTLAVSVDASQRVVAVRWGEHSCVGEACRGASTSSPDPSNDLAERSFFFGRTALFEPAAGVNASARPAWVLDGTLVAPAQ